MLRLMLNRHPRCFVPFESRFIPEFADHPLATGAGRSPDDMRALLGAIVADEFVRKGQLVPDAQAVMARAPRTYAQLVDAIFRVRAEAEGKTRWGDKTPTYVLEMDRLWRLFPGCRFIHLIRDGRDVACSLRRVSWGSGDLLRAARDWRWKVSVGRKMGAMIPDHYLEVRYESLVLDPRRTLQDVCAFLGEAFDETMLRYPEDAAEAMPVQSLQWHQSSISAPDPSRVGLWRRELSAVDARIFDDEAGDLLATLGYERTDSPRTIFTRARYVRYALLGHA